MWISPARKAYCLPRMLEKYFGRGDYRKTCSTHLTVVSESALANMLFL